MGRLHFPHKSCLTFSHFPPSNNWDFPKFPWSTVFFVLLDTTTKAVIIIIFFFMSQNSALSAPQTISS